MSEVLYYIEPQDDFVAEGRYFYKGEIYPVLRKDEGFRIVTSENGAFHFKKSLMPEVVKEWNLKIHQTVEEENTWVD